MNAVYRFDIRNYTRIPSSYFVAAILLCFGLFTGTKANLNTGEGIYLNSPYTIGFMLGLLSLSIIFIATVVGTQQLFKEWDTRFDQLLFSTTLTKKQYITGRFLSFYIVTLTGFLLLSVGFMLGQSIRGGEGLQAGFQPVHYAYPLFLFGCINALLVCSILSLIAWCTKNKLLVAVSGLMLYVLYMIVLLFSSSPFMAQSIPQSLQAQYISAVIDPFGLSAYFFESRSFSVMQRNTSLTPLTGTLLLNRLLVTGISLLFLYLGQSYFQLTDKKYKRKQQDTEKEQTDVFLVSSSYQTVLTAFNIKAQIQAVRSFLKTDLIYIFRSIPIVITMILVLFLLGMEMYAEIEKGIRLPQKFASSGLMASAILENFYLPGVFLVIYYANDLYWRSTVHRFSILENATVLSTSKLIGHWLSMILLILFFSLTAILLGLVFQFAYHYTQINMAAYGGVLIFNTCPLLLLSGFVLLLNRLIPHKYLALGITLMLALIVASPLANKILSAPLLKFFSDFKGVYSDFNGYGSYLKWFELRLLFGFCVIVLLWQVISCMRIRKIKWPTLAVMAVLIPVANFSGIKVMQGYKSGDKEQVLEMAANYEKQFRKYQSLPQPTVTNVITKIHLYPSQNRYSMEGEYRLKNQTGFPVQRILINVDEDVKIGEAYYLNAKEKINIKAHACELILQHPLAVKDSAILKFQLSYAWKPVNGHKSVNAIIENGSFMRISRYYPQIGYVAQNEVKGDTERKQFGLGESTPLKRLEDPRTLANDFIQLDMTIDTEEGQIAVGTGELVKEWSRNGRHYFQYKQKTPIPFRFAVACAFYKMKRIMYDHIQMTVLYHPLHEENVEHLFHNAKLTMDYCRNNFGPYPFKTLTFAEVSSFTRGFAATAYPATVFMTEDMIFHANIHADEQQDVINELAGHELSHLWWGNNQVAPDEREGAAMLTETLAMYTEMMLYKKMYGKEEMMKRLNMHQQIYAAEKGFALSEPLYKVTSENTHISYSKGAVIMVQLSELIGEDNVNKALRNFLANTKKSDMKPIAMDLINEIMKVSEVMYHSQIRNMFMEI